MPKGCAAILQVAISGQSRQHPCNVQSVREIEKCPPFMRHSLTWRSSAPETMSGKSGVEGRPVDATVVALQYILHHRVPAAKQVRVHLQARPALSPAVQRLLASLACYRRIDL